MSYAQWVPTAYYEPTDVVYDGSLAYQCLVANGPPAPKQPSSFPFIWAELSVADITAVLAGTGISVANPGGPTPTVNNAGVLSVTSGSGISVTAGQNPQIDNTGVLSVLSGTGISITGATSNPTIQNTGVLSIDNQSGVVTTKAGGAYKTVAQNLTSGNTFITWEALLPWNDTGYITLNAIGSDTFTVNTKGLYQLEHVVTVAPNGATWTTATNKSAAIMLTRAPGTEQALLPQTSMQAVQAYGIITGGLVELLVGDTIRCRHGNTFTGGPPQAQPLQNTYDYNTTFAWRLVKPLP